LLAPFKIIARVMIKAATAVAATIVKNQYNRFPRKRKGLARVGFVGGTGWLERVRSDWLPVRRRGDSQGKIVWT
jgi:hypothetical protein